MPKEYRGFLAFDDAEDVIYSPFYHGRGAGPADMLSAEILGYRCNVVNPRDPRYVGDLRRFPSADQIFIWGHGNQKRSCLGGEDGTTVDAQGIVDDFVALRLPRAWDGTVILWSCFAGVAGGFAEALFIRLRAAGYNALGLFAPTLATGGLTDITSEAYKGLLLYGAGTHAKAGALDAAMPQAIAESMPGWNGAKTICTIGDLRQITLGQRLVAEV